jgi:tRNA nucleotidyltransferase/poly(A) polymerase
MITKFTEFILEKNIPFKIDLPDDIYQIKEEFDKAGKKLYVVGGAVRDFYLGKKPHDIDLVTDAQPEESKKILKDKFYVSDEQGKSFGVLRIYTKTGPKEGYELATFRKDISKGRDTKTEGPKVEIGKHITIEDDVKRRDLTMNALFYDIDKEEIVDLVGGLEDIEKNIISAVGEPSERFIEDRLRILRTFRFAARNLSEIKKGTIDAILKDKRLRNVSPIDDVSKERIVEEFIKAVKWSADNENMQSLNYYLELLKKYDMFSEMFPNLDIDIEGINTFNLSIIFALLFRNNKINRLRNKLSKFKFPGYIADTACFLLRLQKHIKNLEKIPVLYKEKVRYHVDDQTIEEFADLYGFNDNYLQAFLKFKPKVDGKEIMRMGFKNAEIGAEIKRREIEQFKELL